MTVCLHCNGLCRLTNGGEVYPHRPDLATICVWKCEKCPDSIVGCHPGTTKALGYAACKRTRSARIQLHRLVIDPLWKNVTTSKGVQRSKVYSYLSAHMGIDRAITHTGMFTASQCRAAEAVLANQTPQTIHKWNKKKARLLRKQNALLKSQPITASVP